MTLTDYYSELTDKIYSEGFNLDSLVNKVTHNMFESIEELFKEEYFNYSTELKKIVSNLAVSLRCLVVDLCNIWLSFYSKEFWTFVENAVIKYEFMKQFIFEALD